MKIKDIASGFGAYIVAIAVFLAASYIYCSPVLSGKVVGGGDNDTAAGVSHETQVYRAETGDNTWWTNSVFSGMPTYQLGGSVWASNRLLKPVKALVDGPHNVGWTVFLYFLCFFVLLRSFKVGRWLSIPGALATGLSSYFLVIIAAGHMSKCWTLALVALVVAGFRFIFDKRYGLGTVLVMFFVALGFPPHPQMFYYYFMMLGLFWAAELWIHFKEKRYRDFIVATAIFVVATGIGLGARSSNIFANSEYITQTLRGGSTDIVREGEEASKGLDLEYATQWSYGIDETMSFLIPGFKGGASSVNVGKDSELYRTLVRYGVSGKDAAGFCANTPLYWGEQPFTAGNIYLGAVICFLFLLGLLIVRGPYKWALLASTLFSVALAWGSNFMWLTEMFFKYFPMYSKYRTVSSILIVAEVAVPVLAFLALKEILGGKVGWKELKKAIFISGGITAGICLFFALFGGAMFDFKSSYDAQWASGLPEWVYSGILAERVSLFRSDCWRSLLFVLLGVAAVWAYARGSLRNSWFIAVLSVLVIADMWPVDKRYFNDDNFIRPARNGNAFAMQPYEKVLLQDPEHFRVFNLTVNTFNDARTSYYLKSIGGYSAVKLRRYQDLIDEYLGKCDMKVAGMLNAKYVIVPGGDRTPEPQLNPYALGNAWFVGRVVRAESAAAESDSLAVLDLSREAVVGADFASFIPAQTMEVPSDASVVLNSYSPKELDYTSVSSVAGTVVFSEIYYPFGWKASIDGVEAEHFRANYLLRAINVPAGEHNIHFIFDPDSVRKGETLAVIFIILMYAITAVIAGVGIYRLKRARTTK